MAETLFAFDEHNYRAFQTRFCGEGSEPFRLGDYAIDPASVIDARAERKLIGPHIITRLTSRTRLTFRRAWAHIRADATDVTVLWFLKRGRLRVSNQNGPVLAEPGQFVVTRSMTPFVVECLPDDERVHEVLHLALPTHAARAFIPDAAATGFCVPTDRRGFAIAESILVNLLQDDDEIASDTGEILINGALSAIGHAIRDRYVCRRPRRTASDRRLEEILRFIEVHLSNPNLSIAMVANGCGVSPRHLSFLLKQHGASFSTLVWERRLSKAKDWLEMSVPNEVSIGEIAYSVGFKSPAHFSRMFKRVFKLNPSDYRSASG